MKITVETIQNKKLNEVNELFYNSFLEYGKKTADYIAIKHDMSKEYCSMYIASGLYTLYLERFEQLRKDGELFTTALLKAYYGTRKLVKKIMAMTNYSSYFKNNTIAYDGENTVYKLPKYKKSNNQYSEYRNIKKVNSHVIDIIDVLEQKENRSHKKELSLDNDSDYDFKNNIVSYYPTPEQELLNKLSRTYSAQFANKIRSDKKYDRLCFIFEKIKNDVNLANSEVDFLYNFKKRYGVEVLTSKELLHIVSNY